MAFNVINSGQRNVNVAPQLVALSSIGGFRLSGPAAKALDVKPTDYVMFLHDDETGAWAIAKGYACMKSDGTPQMCSARVNRVAIVEANFDEAITSAMASDNEELKARLSVEGISHDEQVEILAEFVDVPETQKYQGSKCASPSGLTGVGANVNFTDSNVWNQLKSDMEDKGSLNRVFDLDTDEVIELSVKDGYKDVTIKALVLGDYKDVTPIARGAKDEDAE